MLFLTSLLAIAGLAFSAVLAPPTKQHCLATVDGAVFNFTLLAAATIQLQQGSPCYAPQCAANKPEDTLPWNIFISICSPLKTITAPCTGAAVCQEWLGGSASMGAYSTVAFQRIPGYSTNQGVRMVGTKGTADTVDGKSIERSFQIDFVCPSKINGAHETSQSHPTFTNEDEKTLSYQLTWINTAGCPVSGGSGGSGSMSGGSIFVIIVIVGFSSYCLLGIIFMGAVKGARGAEMIPNYGFWSEFPKYVRDGFGFVKSKVTGGSSASYATV